MRPFVARVIACTVVFFAAALAPAQSRKSPKELPPAAYKLIEVTITGTKRYKTEDVVPASGLQIGQTVHEEDFQDAARRLGDTGAFTDISYKFEYSPDGTKLELQLQDAARFVPVRFENVVWFSDQELFDKLHAQVSLFRGELPVTGQLPDQLSEALQAVIIQKKVPGNVDYIRVSHGDGPTEAFAYSVTGPRILVRKVNFSGAGSEELPQLQSAAKLWLSAEYVRSTLRAQEDKSFLPIYLARGYLKASFSDPEATIAEETDDGTLVDVTITVNPGTQYKLAGLELAGNKAFPSDILRPLIQLKVDQPANTVQLDQGVQAIKQLYATRGYAIASVTPEEQINDAQATITYKITIIEGDVYKMGDLEISGLDSPTKARMQNNWTLRTGDIFDAGYPRRFADKAQKDLGGDWRITIRDSVNTGDKTVDITIRFDPK